MTKIIEQTNSEPSLLSKYLYLLYYCRSRECLICRCCLLLFLCATCVCGFNRVGSRIARRGCSLSLWRVARGSKHMFLELIHGFLKPKQSLGYQQHSFRLLLLSIYTQLVPFITAIIPLYTNEIAMYMIIPLFPLLPLLPFSTYLEPSLL